MLKNIIELGQGQIERWTLCEFKNLFSIYIHRINTVEQDRFHSHAFHSIVFLIKGGYAEEYKSLGDVKVKTVFPGIRFISRNYTHRILTSLPNTLSVVFAGPWRAHWIEENDEYVKTLGWGRKEIRREYK